MHAECNGANDGATEGEQAAARGLEYALIQKSHAKQQREPNCLLNERMEWLCNVGVGSIGADLTLALQSRRHALRSTETEVCALTPRVAETRMQFSCTDPRRSWLNNECAHTSNDANCLNLCCLARASALPRLLSADCVTASSQTQRMQAAYPMCASLQCTSPPPLRFLGCPAALAKQDRPSEGSLRRAPTGAAARQAAERRAAKRKAPAGALSGPREPGGWGIRCRGEGGRRMRRRRRRRGKWTRASPRAGAPRSPTCRRASGSS
jgi:hypothetical protein